MIAVGLDIGGTKIETQCFDDDWNTLSTNRVDTPVDYTTFVDVVAEQVISATAGSTELPVGLGCAGLLNPVTGKAFTANLPATGQTLLADVNARTNGSAVWINDCRALTLSEAVFGAGRGERSVAGLILGTGVGGGVATDGQLLPEWSGTGGEFGHISAPAALVAEYGLPIETCGCGKRGCVETFIAGPGLSRVVKAISGQDLSPTEIGSLRASNPAVARAWGVWCAIVADLIISVTYVADPDVVILGGGLSKISDVTTDLQRAVEEAQFPGYRTPKIRLAQGGDASGARGAAYFAWTNSNRPGGTK